MKTRSPRSFKTALNQFLDECRSIASRSGQLAAQDLDHLDRWARDDRAEKVWQTIQKLAWKPAGGYDPLDAFIVIVLSARQMAESISVYLQLIERKKRRAHQFEQYARQSEERAKLWAYIGADNHAKSALALQRAEFHKHEAQIMSQMAKKPPRSPPFLISRVDKNGSQKQRAFMQVIGDYLFDLCGKHLDAEVAVLNDIAFATEEATQPYQARSARRATTRVGRSKRVEASAEQRLIKS